MTMIEKSLTDISQIEYRWRNRSAQSIVSQRKHLFQIRMWETKALELDTMQNICLIQYLKCRYLENIAHCIDYLELT